MTDAIAIINYGVGNLFSLRSSLEALGETAVVTSDANVIKRARRLILPGVGAFGKAVTKLRESGLFDAVKSEAEGGKPLLGICLGMQMLFERSLEFGEFNGLGLIPGEVLPIKPIIPGGYKVPHIGWNALKFPPGRKSLLFKHSENGDHVYFVHSYSAQNCGDFVSAAAEYGAEITAAAERGNVFGTQFHPEKSGEAGLRILRAFCEI